MKESQDKREFSRVPLPFPVRLTHGETVVESDQGMDVSAIGLAIKTHEQIPVGSSCKVEILLAEDMIITAEGLIVRELEDGMAIQITEITLSGYELLKHLIRFNSNDPARIDREFDQHLGLKAR